MMLSHKRNQIFTEFYELSAKLDDDIDLICDMMHNLCRVSYSRKNGTWTKPTQKRSITKRQIERAEYEKIERETFFILSMPDDVFKAHKDRIKGNSKRTAVRPVASKQ